MSRLVSLTTLSLIAVSYVCSGLASGYGQYAGSQPVPSDLKPGFDSITVPQATEWLEILAGDEFAGRGTGQSGFMKAAHWVAGKAAEFGLEPMGEGGTYFQMMPLARTTADTGESKMSVGDSLTIEAAGNLGFERSSGQPLVEGKVVFVRSGEGLPALADNLVLEGKVVFFLVDDAHAAEVATTINSKRPAAALRIVEAVPNSAATNVIRGAEQTTHLTGSIAKSAALKIIESVGGNDRWFDLAAKNQRQLVELDKTARIEMRFREEPAAYPNVCAWIEGSDPALRHEYVVIGAHLDHLGTRGDAIFYGADDNGSGSTAVLSIARAIATNPIKPKRSVLFLWFTGEEMGLLGSAHYCDHPLLPLDKMICMFNIDMVGRNEEKDGDAPSANVKSIHLIGSKQGDPDLHEVIMRANEHIDFDFEYDEEGVFGRSDQANFYRKANTSVAFLFGGFHPDYHQPSDQPAKINYEKLVSAAKLFYLSIYFAAEHGPFPVPAK